MNKVWPLSWIVAPLTWLGLQLGVNKSFFITGPHGRDSALDGCGQIYIDTSYHLYIRDVCRKRPLQDHYNWHGANRPEAETAWCNCNGADGSLELLERDYLLVSTKRGNVIGIMPYPPYVDWTKDNDERRAYLYDRTLFRQKGFVNIWWANRFHFGRIGADGRTVRFQHKNNGDANYWKWHFTSAGDLRLDSVIWMRDNGDVVRFASDKAAGLPTTFRRQPDSYVLGFQSSTDDVKFDPTLAESYALRTPNIIYIDKYKGSNRRYLVRFETIPDGSDTVAVASFDDPAIASSPEALLDVGISEP